SRCQTISGACALVADSIQVASGNVFRATGSRPLLLLGATAIDIAGTVDVASRSNFPGTGNGVGGAGADPASCPIIVEGIAPNGGAGGSFGTRGGNGGASGGSLGGVSAPAVVATSLRGGCPGSGGGASGGAGGAGG